MQQKQQQQQRQRRVLKARASFTTRVLSVLSWFCFKNFSALNFLKFEVTVELGFETQNLENIKI